MRCKVSVSIQPKPKKGLVEKPNVEQLYEDAGFNPAEAEEGFSSFSLKCGAAREVVSIQPKPKKGLVAEFTKYADFRKIRVSIQPKPKKGLVEK